MENLTKEQAQELNKRLYGLLNQVNTTISQCDCNNELHVKIKGEFEKTKTQLEGIIEDLNALTGC